MLIYQPRPPLSSFIECLWHADLHAPSRREKILPTGTLELIINFGAPFRLYDRDNPLRCALHSASWLVGLQTGYLTNEPIAETHMIGVRFKPAGAAMFFDLPAAELHNRVVPIDALWGSFAAEMRERLYAAPTPALRFALLEQLLLARLLDQPRGLRAIRFAVAALAGSDGALAIKSLSDQIGMSQKHLAAQFQQLVGVSPKALARIFRFQRVLHSIDPAQPLDWAAVAHGALYYDQSHFNKDFARFAGLTPTEYVQLRRNVFGSAVARGEDVHFVPIG
jgi:AraC-like DNA-binding protein